jgi:biotin operon repressor
MAKKKASYCMDCQASIEKDEIALSKKLLGRQIENFLCINCLAEYLNCTTDDLRIKIDEFREQGCSLFI